MKKLLLLTASIFIIENLVTAQTATKRVLFEHFTNVCCGPCAAQNPIFQENILATNWGKIHHISYHPSWPCDTDPMYVPVKSDIDTRVAYYGVSGVPGMFHGNEFEGGPSEVTQTIIDDIANKGSVISIRITEVDSTNSTRYVNVKVTTVGSAPSGDLRLRVAVVEKDISFSDAPGSNGETFFPNVFRKMLPNIDGETYTPATQGSTVEFNYSYTLDNTWDADSIYTIAFVQNHSTKYVFNSASSIDPSAEVSMTSETFKNSYPNNSRKFDGTVQSTGEGTEQYSVKVTDNAPSDWTGQFTVNGTYYSSDSTATVNLASGESATYSIVVTPGTSPAISTYTLEVKSASNPSSIAATQKVTVISGVTDLVVNVDNALNEGEDNDVVTNYKKGFSNAGKTSYAVTDQSTMVTAFTSDELFAVKNIYYNAGWSSSSLTDEVVDGLTKHIDAGGRLFISGQDIGWEVNESTDAATLRAKGKTFYTNYLSSTYVQDALSSATYISANTNDAVFTGIASSDIDKVYGTSSYFPDEIAATGDGKNVFYYNGDADNVAAVRTEKWNATSNLKTFYLAIGIEMLQSSAVSQSLVETIHDWFSDVTSTEEFENQIKQLTVSQNYPNPASKTTTIKLNGLESSSELRILDIVGKIVKVKQIPSNAQSLNIDISDLNSGSYIYQILDKSGNLLTVQNMNVVK